MRQTRWRRCCDCQWSDFNDHVTEIYPDIRKSPANAATKQEGKSKLTKRHRFESRQNTSNPIFIPHDVTMMSPFMTQTLILKTETRPQMQQRRPLLQFYKERSEVGVTVPPSPEFALPTEEHLDKNGSLAHSHWILFTCPHTWERRGRGLGNWREIPCMSKSAVMQEKRLAVPSRSC